MFVSAMTIYELEIGTLQRERRDPAPGRDLRRWLDTKVVRSFQGRVLPIDAAIAKRCAELNVPNSRPFKDAMIAATALVHGMTVVTRNVRDFAPMGVEALDPWLAKP